MAQLTPGFFQTILKIEGGYQNRADDSGNYACGDLIGTKYGVSAGALQTWWGRCPSAAEMQALTETQAFGFYAWYFDKYNLYPIQSQKLFELCANNTMGNPYAAARVEQKALNSMGFNVAEDGQRGTETITALNKAWNSNPGEIYNRIRSGWISYLQSLNKPQFLTGWLYRINNYFPPIGSTSSNTALAAFVALLLFMALKSRKNG